MAIDFSAVHDGNAAEDAMLSEINTTPLVDVMLVLLIIFLITIPVVNAAVAVRLPKESNPARALQPDTVIISIDAQGDNFWYDARLPNAELLRVRLATVAAQNPQPLVHIRADAQTDYAAVARVILACQQAGIVRIAFLTEPVVER